MVNHDNDKLVSALSYILVGIIWYFVDKDVQNKTTKFHVKQAINLLLVSLVLNIALTILTVISFGLLGPVIGLLNTIFGIFILVLWVIGLIYSIQLNQKELPIIGQFANKYLKF